jgi:hypothetical protein
MTFCNATALAEAEIELFLAVEADLRHQPGTTWETM